ncbi:MAG: nickel-dependent hydrogenase large subunit [Desulfobacterales bacterium]|nr:nickel-dependent hydrogenase large subunit [Desulfobacterales bacterium]
MFRGIETDPAGARPARCPALRPAHLRGLHATSTRMSSVRAVDDAVGVKIPNNARLIRNLMHRRPVRQHDHVIHFYHLHALDWVDVVSAAEGRPRQDGGAVGQSISNAP